MKFNEKLKHFREKHGLTQDDVASKLNIARQSVSKWEQGINEPDFATVKQLCIIFDCSIADLIDDDKEVVTSKEVKREKVVKTIFMINSVMVVMSILMLIAIVLLADSQAIIRWDIDFNPVYGSKWMLLINLVTFVLLSFLTGLPMVLGCKGGFYKQYRFVGSIFALIVNVIIIALVFVLTALQFNMGEMEACNLSIIGAFSLIFAISPFSHPYFNKRNPFFGFRTKFTITNEVAWNKLNSLSSILMGISSIIGYVLTIIFAYSIYAMLFILIYVVILIPLIIYHEYLRKHLK